MMARLLALILVFCAAPLAAQTFPVLTGRVVDAANILPPDVEARIVARSAALEEATGAQAVVATIPDLQGYPIEDYGYRLLRHWGIGQKDVNNGVILIVAPTERKVRIEVGYGLEPVMTDGLSSTIIRNTILPKFRAGDMAGGVADGYAAIADQLELPADQAAARARQARPEDDEGVPIGAIIFLAFFIFWIWMAFRASKRGRRSAATGRAGRGVDPIVIWGPGTGWGSGGGRGGWGGGGGWGSGGGGFSGGGGWGGGGGASGGW